MTRYREMCTDCFNRFTIYRANVYRAPIIDLPDMPVVLQSRQIAAITLGPRD